MNAARQACRPKHQVLVLKCYPKFQKNNAEVKANSSELSYLLYYASTRRSKLQKVGDFLDKRTTKDVWKGSVGSVQVTLQIVHALIEKCPRDLPLYAGAVLRILRTILSSNDVAMVEESVPAFDALCAHQEPAALAADQDYAKQYENVVQLYAHFASKSAVHTGKTPATWPVAVRYRKAGLQALKAVASSESLGSDTGRQLAVLIPVILANMHSDDATFLKRLEKRDAEDDEHDKENAVRRRMSLSTAHTADNDESGDPIAASGTTEDADKLQEEKIGVLALQALRNIFQGGNRGQLRLATSAVLDFISTKVKTPQQPAENSSANWSTKLMAMICAWAPVQDRYAIMVSTVEALVKSPIVEGDLERQLGLATIIDHLLSSPINFIGLSVMDVLVGLISHTLLLLQLGGSGSPIQPHHQQTTSILEKDSNGAACSNNPSGMAVEVVKEASHVRVQLLETVQRCMAGLATHVYYTDQISDMVDAILSRLKPSRPTSTSAAVDAIENPAETVEVIANSSNLQEKASVDRFFSFETARIVALEAVKAIITTANTRRPDGSKATVARSKVGVSVWEGTQWLLRDPSGQVRKAYVDALVTWLNFEKQKEDLKIVDNYKKREKENEKESLAKRAVSTASQRERTSRKTGRYTFLPLLHLAVYENALQYVDSEADFLLLHLLLTTLMNRLGVNAVRSGLPMIMRLQEDIVGIEDPGSKVRIGSLVHGYLWALSMAFDFETSSVGQSIHNEITRRNDKGLWVQTIRVPPMHIDLIDTPHPSRMQLPTNVVQSEAIVPFDNREALVEMISEGYSSSLYSPPSSPPGSPSRSMSVTSSVPVIHQPANLKPTLEIPSKAKEDLLAEWSRDICLVSNTKDSSSASMTGSKSGTQYTRNNFLGVNMPNGNMESEANSPNAGSPRRSQSKPPSIAYGLVGPAHRQRSSSNTQRSTSSVRSTVRVDDLKRALSGAGNVPRTSYSRRAPSNRQHDDSSASESMVSVHSLSDSSFVTTDPNTQYTFAPESPSTPAVTLTPRPQTVMSMNFPTMHEGNVPPVPPIPDALRDKSVSPPGVNEKDFARPRAGTNGTMGISVTSQANKSRSVKSGVSRSRGRSGQRGSEVLEQKPDLLGFLDSIEVDDGDDDADDDDEVSEGIIGREVHGVGKAPY